MKTHFAFMWWGPFHAVSSHRVDIQGLASKTTLNEGLHLAAHSVVLVIVQVERDEDKPIQAPRRAEHAIQSQRFSLQWLDHHSALDKIVGCCHRHTVVPHINGRIALPTQTESFFAIHLSFLVYIHTTKDSEMSLKRKELFGQKTRR